MKILIPNSHFARAHLLWPLLGFIFLALVFALSPLDLMWADALYHWSGGYWRYEDAWFTTVVIHDDGRKLVGLVALILIIMTLLVQFRPAFSQWRRGCWYLLCSTVVSGVVINLLKEITHMDCPWDLLRYGGSHPYESLFSAHLGNFKVGACFPAGHASAAYAWLGLYYFCYQLVPRWRYKALMVVMGAGLLFGFSQQLRGAHFLSHDLWTVGICWALASVLYLWFFPVALRSFASEKRKNRGFAASVELLPLES